MCTTGELRRKNRKLLEIKPLLNCLMQIEKLTLEGLMFFRLSTNIRPSVLDLNTNNVKTKVIMQGKLFQRCTHLVYCSVLSLGGNVNTRRMSNPDMGSIFHIKNLYSILVIGNYYVNYQSYQNLMLLRSSDTKLTLMHLYCLQILPRENWFQ